MTDSFIGYQFEKRENDDHKIVTRVYSDESGQWKCIKEYIEDVTA